MIAATYTQNKGYAIENRPIPEIGEDEMLLRVMASSICGTDIRTIRNGHRKLEDGQTVVLGHEFAGIIERAGGRVKGYATGTHVGVAPNIGCGRCIQCARGRYNMCPDYSAYGINLDGAHADFVRIPAPSIEQGSVIPLPDSMSFQAASLIEPLSCVVNGIRSSRIELGDTVLIFGAGPIGLMHLMLARQSGAGKVLVADIQEDRIAQAREAGADDVVNPNREDVGERIVWETDGQGCNVIITACSVPAVQEQALELLAPYGRLCLFGGLPKDRAKVLFDSNLIHYKNLEVTGVTGGAPYDFRLAMKMIESGRIDVGRVISHVFAREDMAEAFDTALNKPAMKIVIRSGKR